MWCTCRKLRARRLRSLSASPSRLNWPGSLQLRKNLETVRSPRSTLEENEAFAEFMQWQASVHVVPGLNKSDLTLKSLARMAIGLLKLRPELNAGIIQYQGVSAESQTDLEAAEPAASMRFSQLERQRFMRTVISAEQTVKKSQSTSPQDPIFSTVVVGGVRLGNGRSIKETTLERESENSWRTAKIPVIEKMSDIESAVRMILAHDATEWAVQQWTHHAEMFCGPAASPDSRGTLFERFQKWQRVVGPVNPEIFKRSEICYRKKSRDGV